MDEIGDYMSSPVLSVDVESTIMEAARYMDASQVGSLLVRKLGGYAGVITETDLTRKVISKGKNPETTLVSEVMTAPVLSMDRYLPVDQANEFMHKNRIRHLAVTESGTIVGMLSVKDLVGYYAQSFRVQE